MTSPDIRPGTPEWEELCQRCGRCCYEKLDYCGEIFYTATPCPHLDVSTQLCRVYQKRTVEQPDCAALDAGNHCHGRVAPAMPLPTFLSGRPFAENFQANFPRLSVGNSILIRETF